VHTGLGRGDGGDEKGIHSRGTRPRPWAGGIASAEAASILREPFLKHGGWDTVDMTPKDADIDNKKTEDPIEDQPADWAAEDRDLEHRKPDLGEIEEDPSEN